MKKIISSVAIALGLAVAANAGTGTVVQDHTVIASTGQYGTGFYLGLQGGINAAQEEVGGLQSEVGGVGGLKAGFVIGTGVVRPTIEADLFYNGFSQSAGGVVRDIDSGAFMANFLVRFDLGQFQPYVGGGVGGYTADSTGSNNGAPISGASAVAPTGGPGGAVGAPAGGAANNGPDSKSGFAWQAVAGVDFYFTPTVSIFSEYKFLNYNSTNFASNDFQQHLVVLGVRMHF